MDFTRCVENVELHRSRAWTHVVLRASEARCDNKCKKKPSRGVSEEAREINKITHGNVVLLRARQTSCESSTTLTRLQNSVRKVVHGLHTLC